MKLSKLGSSLERGIHAVSGWIVWVSVATLFLMMLLSFSDVIGRQVFNAPIKAVPEIIELMMVVAIFLGAAYVTLRRAHIRVDALTSRLPRRPRLILDNITTFLCAATVTLMVWRLVIRTMKSLLNPISGGATGILMVPYGPFFAIATIGMIFLCLEFWIQFIRSFSPPLVTSAPASDEAEAVIKE